MASETAHKIAPLLLRLVVGVIFIAHGGQKLFGLWGGSGFDATVQGFESMGFAPGILWAGFAGGTEFFAGMALMIGLLTKLAALGLVITMAVAVFKVHWAAGLFAQNGGFEYPLTLLVVCFVLLLRGAGPYSIDGQFLRK